MNEAKKNIPDKCSDFMAIDNISAHEAFLHRPSRHRVRDQRLRKFTTNYDLCFECAATNIGCVAIYGFSFMVPRQYDPRYFDYDIIRRPRFGEENGNYLEGFFLLYKLHGSVNWEKQVTVTL
ncbi:MAG: SIR2 family protein [Treponema sp.]|nr:SIR2 family protein [Treponema sp.]